MYLMHLYQGEKCSMTYDVRLTRSLQEDMGVSVMVAFTIDPSSHVLFKINVICELKRQ